MRTGDGWDALHDKYTYQYLSAFASTCFRALRRLVADRYTTYVHYSVRIRTISHIFDGRGNY